MTRIGYPRLLLFAALFLLLLYATLLGATYNGILAAATRSSSAWLLAGVLALWLVGRTARGWRWHTTALDLAILLWAVAFFLSLIVNFEEWRRIAMGVWYMGVYALLWYLLHDLLANRATTRALLTDALLITGGLLLLFGVLQTVSWARETLGAMLAGNVSLALPRPVSSLGNPNTFAAVLVCLFPLAAARAFSTRGLPRFMWSIYTGLALLLLFFTYSRGGWIGGGAAIIVFIFLIGNVRGWRTWLQDRHVQVALGAAALISLIAALFLISSLSVAGRTLDLRTFLFESAWTMFQEQPLAGHGLFTFGGHLARLNPTPPTEPHSHAHSLPFNVAAELGIVGLAALVVTLVLVRRAIASNLSTAAARERFLLMGGAAGVMGFSVHHLTDLPAMNPAVMVVGIVVFVIAGAPTAPIVLQRSRNLLQSALVVTGALTLGMTGIWEAGQYQQYSQVLSDAARTGGYAEAAAQLQTLIDADPGFALPYHQQGLLYGLAAAQCAAGESQRALALYDWSQPLPNECQSFAERGAAAYERYTTLAPYYHYGWVNLAALYTNLGDSENAARAQAQAERLIPSAVDPFTADYAAILDAINAGNGQMAVARWQTIAADLLVRTPRDEALAGWVTLANEDVEAAQFHLNAIQQVNPYDVWGFALSARIAEENSDAVAANAAREAAWTLLEREPFAPENERLPNIQYIQWLRLAIPRQYLPQTAFVAPDPLLLRMLGRQ